MSLNDRLKQTLMNSYEFISDKAWIVKTALMGLYYGADLIGQTLGDSSAIDEAVRYGKNQPESTFQFNPETNAGIALSLIASVPFTLTIVSVNRARRRTAQRHVLLVADEEPITPSHHHKQNLIVRAIIIITRPAPFFALVYGSTSAAAHALIKNKTKKIGPEIAIQLFCLSFSSINAANRFSLHTHHANAAESYFDLLRQLPFRQKAKATFLTTTLAFAHGFEGFFEIGVGVEAFKNMLFFFGTPQYQAFNGLALSCTIYFSASMLVDATRTEGRSILLKMRDGDAQQSYHWGTTLWLWVVRIPHGLMPALGAIEFANLLYCMASSNFDDLTPECPNNLTSDLSFVPRMLLLGATSMLFGYGAAEGAAATCREAADHAVWQADKVARKIASGFKTKLNHCYANFFKQSKTTSVEEELELVPLPESSSTLSKF